MILNISFNCGDDGVSCDYQNTGSSLQQYIIILIICIKFNNKIENHLIHNHAN